MKSLARITRAVTFVLAAGALSGCVSDPAFWDALAMGLDEAAYQMANDPDNCPMVPDGWGGVMRDCGDPNAISPGDVIYLPGVD